MAGGGVGPSMGNLRDPELGSTELGWEECVGGCCLHVMVALPAPAPGVGGVLSPEINVTFAGHIFMLAQGKGGTAFIRAGKHKTPMHH